MTKSAAKVSKEDSRRPPCKPYPVSATPTNALRALVNSRGVHELVARTMRGEHVRQRAERKSVVLLSSVTAYYPCVRTYHTKEPSRFVHALSARPLKVHGGRDSNMRADGTEYIFFAFSVGCTRTLSCRGEHRSPAKKHEETFPLSYFCMTKSTKSQQGGLAPSSFRTTVRRARVSRASHAWRVRAVNGRAKIGCFAALRNLNHTTRANIAHEIAEQIRARIVCTPAINAGRA